MHACSNQTKDDSLGRGRCRDPLQGSEDGGVVCDDHVGTLVDRFREYRFRQVDGQQYPVDLFPYAADDLPDIVPFFGVPKWGNAFQRGNELVSFDGHRVKFRLAISP